MYSNNAEYDGILYLIAAEHKLFSFVIPIVPSLLGLIVITSSIESKGYEILVMYHTVSASLVFCSFCPKLCL